MKKIKLIPLFFAFCFIFISVYATPTLNHIMIIWGENANYGTSTVQPYLYQLMTTYAEYSNYHALTHPSEPNYIAFGCGALAVSADYYGCLSLTNVNLVDRLEAGGVDWREYEEGLITHCLDSTNGYYIKHDFFTNFTSVNMNSSRLNKIVGFDGSQRATYSELTGTNPPPLVMVTPNICNDGHDCGMTQFNSWLRDSTFFQDMLNSKYYTDGAIFVTMDENAGASGNRIYCVAVSAYSKPAYKASTSYNHYNLLRTVEDNWGLATLTSNDAAASNMFEALNVPMAVDLKELSVYASPNEWKKLP